MKCEPIKVKKLCKGCAIQEDFLKNPGNRHWECRVCNCNSPVTIADINKDDCMILIGWDLGKGDYSG